MVMMVMIIMMNMVLKTGFITRKRAKWKAGYFFVAHSVQANKMVELEHMS